MEELLSSAIIVIYPDGDIENVKLDNRNYHIQYLLGLIENSDKLKKIIKEKNIELPKNSKFITESTCEIDLELAKEGIIILHIASLDDETLEGYYITLPSSFSDMQKEILTSIFNIINIEDNRFGRINGNEFLDITVDEVQDMLASKTK